MNKRIFIKKFFLFLFFSFFSLKLRPKEMLTDLIVQKKRNFSQNILIMFDPIFLKYHLSPEHPEDPRRISYIEKEFKKHGLNTFTSSFNKNLSVFNALKQIHTKDHISSIKKNYPQAYEVAIAAIQSTLSAVNEVCSGNKRNAFCVIRPPGHHALNTGKEEGFCYFNNIAIAAKYAQQIYDLKKILIIDWDYHHGNSTEYFFYKDPTVLFFSTHDQFAYPLTGDPRKKGDGPGKGFNINVHLPCGTSDNDILHSFEKYLLSPAEQFKPELILISAGFDSKENDPLGCFKVSNNGFIKLTEFVMRLAKKYSNNRIISLLEGGYNLPGNASAVVSHVKTLMNYKG